MFVNIYVFLMLIIFFYRKEPQSEPKTISIIQSAIHHLLWALPCPEIMANIVSKVRSKLAWPNSTFLICLPETTGDYIRIGCIVNTIMLELQWENLILLKKIWNIFSKECKNPHGPGEHLMFCLCLNVQIRRNSNPTVWNVR